MRCRPLRITPDFQLVLSSSNSAEKYFVHPPFLTLKDDDVLIQFPIDRDITERCLSALFAPISSRSSRGQQQNNFGFGAHSELLVKDLLRVKGTSQQDSEYRA